MCIHYTNSYYILIVRTSIYSYKHFMLYTYITSWNIFSMKHKRVNVKMKKTNNCIGVGTTIERDNRRTSKKFLLSYRFNEVKECQGTLCQRAVLQWKFRSRDQKRKVDLLQKTATTNFDRAVLLPKVPPEPGENGLSGGDRVGTGFSVGNTTLLSSVWAFSSFIVISCLSIFLSLCSFLFSCLINVILLIHWSNFSSAAKLWYTCCGVLELIMITFWAKKGITHMVLRGIHIAYRSNILNISCANFISAFKYSTIIMSCPSKVYSPLADRCHQFSTRNVFAHHNSWTQLPTYYV